MYQIMCINKVLSVSSISSIPPNTKCIKIGLKVTLFQTLFYFEEKLFLYLKIVKKSNFWENGHFCEKSVKKTHENVKFAQYGQFDEKVVKKRSKVKFPENSKKSDEMVKKKINT